MDPDASECPIKMPPVSKYGEKPVTSRSITSRLSALRDNRGRSVELCCRPLEICHDLFVRSIRLFINRPPDIAAYQTFSLTLKVDPICTKGSLEVKGIGQRSNNSSAPSKIISGKGISVFIGEQRTNGNTRLQRRDDGDVRAATLIASH